MIDKSQAGYELKKLIKRAEGNMWTLEQQYPNIDWGNRRAALSRNQRRAFNDYRHNSALLADYKEQLAEITL